jgi:hypothetical protein
MVMRSLLLTLLIIPETTAIILSAEFPIWNKISGGELAKVPPEGVAAQIGVASLWKATFSTCVNHPSISSFERPKDDNPKTSYCSALLAIFIGGLAFPYLWDE